MHNKPMENEEVSFKELIATIKVWCSYLLLQWKLIVIGVLIGVIGGVAYSLIKKPTYTATLSFAVEDEKSGGGLGSALGLASSLGLDMGSSGGSLFTGANLAELFKSRSMVEKTLMSPVNVDGRIVSLAEMYIDNNDWREKWEKDPNLSKIQFLPNSNRKLFIREQDSILGVIYQNLSKKSLSVAQKDKKVAIITMEVSSTDELFSLYFCRALAKEVGKFYISTKSKKARTNMEILERQTDSIRRELNGAITGVAIANDNTFNLNPALNVRRTPSARRQVDVQANTAILTELVKQSELAKVTLRKETPLIQVIDEPILPLNVEKVGKIKGGFYGFFLGTFLTLVFLIVKRLYNTYI
ncbi:MAG: lipopolysaccharide biosynthesis protein [Flavobacterium sp.]|uniref:Wzz/FepE/Etk N-terminal domain-containing protein n=1 Tax=Flavobacterium sp. TaxID=239 RepID=UPI001B2F6728|nr:Wzz/FepE/Etk N-terminal domain-containing protein [Flavobacterium sp.]MBO9585940.1 lipopolysaccharide biosynthesis protein [Flavobacterium sp.]